MTDQDPTPVGTPGATYNETPVQLEVVDLDDVRRLCDETECADWTVSEQPKRRGLVFVVNGIHPTEEDVLVGVFDTEQDARFAVTARDLLPRMADELQQARERLAAVEALVYNGQTVGWIERDGDIAWVAVNAVRDALRGDRP